MPGAGGMPFDFSGAGGGEGFDFDSVLREMFGAQSRGRRRGPQPQAGADVSARLAITLPDAVLGCEKAFTVDHKKLTAKIPAGVDTGSRVRLAGQGEPGAHGGPPGDLYLELTIEPHAFLRREGQDLYLDLPVTVKEALLGADVAVPTLQGSGTVTIRPGSQSGTKLRLRGKGVPSLKGGAVGDLYFVLQVKLPETADDALKRAAEALELGYQGSVRANLKL
jgi:curved DNA-binding protein